MGYKSTPKSSYWRLVKAINSF